MVISLRMRVKCLIVPDTKYVLNKSSPPTQLRFPNEVFKLLTSKVLYKTL